MIQIKTQNRPIQMTDGQVEPSPPVAHLRNFSSQKIIFNNLPDSILV